MEKPPTKIMLRIPAVQGTTYCEQSKQLLRWARDPRYDLDIDYIIYEKPIDSIRNRVIKEFLQSDNEYLLCMDDDIIPAKEPAPDVLETLLAADKDIVCPLIFSITRHKLFDCATPKPLCVRQNEQGDFQVCLRANTPEDSQIETHMMPGGCHLIRRHVLEKIPKPIYHYSYDADGVLSTASDESFSRAAMDAGFKIYVHVGAVCEQMALVGTMAFSRSISNGVERAAEQMALQYKAIEQKKKYEQRRKVLLYGRNGARS